MGTRCAQWWSSAEASRAPAATSSSPPGTTCSRAGGSLRSAAEAAPGAGRQGDRRRREDRGDAPTTAGRGPRPVSNCRSDIPRWRRRSGPGVRCGPPAIPHGRTARPPGLRASVSSSAEDGTVPCRGGRAFSDQGRRVWWVEAGRRGSGPGDRPARGIRCSTACTPATRYRSRRASVPPAGGVRRARVGDRKQAAAIRRPTTLPVFAGITEWRKALLAETLATMSCRHEAAVRTGATVARAAPACDRMGADRPDHRPGRSRPTPWCWRPSSRASAGRLTTSWQPRARAASIGRGGDLRSPRPQSPGSPPRTRSLPRPAVDGQRVKASGIASPSGAGFAQRARQGVRTCSSSAPRSAGTARRSPSRRATRLVTLVARRPARTIGLTAAVDTTCSAGAAASRSTPSYLDRVARVPRSCRVVCPAWPSAAPYDGVGIPAVIGSAHRAVPRSPRRPSGDDRPSAAVRSGRPRRLGDERSQPEPIGTTVDGEDRSRRPWYRTPVGAVDLGQRVNRRRHGDTGVGADLGSSRGDALRAGRVVAVMHDTPPGRGTRGSRWSPPRGPRSSSIRASSAPATFASTFAGIR